MIWLVMVGNVSKKSISVRKMTVHWKQSILQKCANLNKSASKTHQFSASFLLHSSTQLLRDAPWRTQHSSNLQGFYTSEISASQNCCTPFMLRKFVFISSEKSLSVRVTGLAATVFRALGWTPSHPASHHPEWSTRSSVRPFFSLATDQPASHGPGCVIRAAWGANYSEDTAVTYPCNFMAEHHEIGQKLPHFEPVGVKNLEKQILF